MYKRQAVPGPETVAGALAGAGKAAQPAVLAQPGEFPAPAGENFMDIGLMPHIPDNAVRRAVKDTVQRNRQLHHAQIGGKMSARFGYGADQKFTDLPGELREPVSYTHLPKWSALRAKNMRPSVQCRCRRIGAGGRNS